MARQFFITTAIDYTNGPPHIGHAYEKVLADVLARYHRLKGESVFFLTGVDQHGQKVQQSAERAGVPPQQFVDQLTQKFVRLWEKLEVRYDRWAATTDPIHQRCVQGILQRLFDEGQIYKATQTGYYSIRQEQFLTDKERGPDGDFGSEWGEVEQRTEENYYFRLAEHRDWLLKYLRAHPDCVTPDFRQRELENAVEKLSGDLCISRPRSRLTWGIQLPFDPAFVTYVWFDALTNYISFAGYDPRARDWADQPNEFRSRWPALHVIGKDILIPAHGIYWPIMLHSLGFPDEQMPRFLVHGWWNISGAKMSKSLGNVIDPDQLADKYGAEALRYYLMSDIVTGKDSDFSEERLVERYNAELANSLGNLLNRSLNMAQRYLKDAGIRFRPGAPANSDIPARVSDMAAQFISHTDKYAVEAGMTAGEFIARICNQHIDREKPWEIAKDPSRSDQLSSLLYTLAESLRIIAILISPVLPRAAHGIFDQLNWKTEPDFSGKESRFSLTDAEWGKLPDGHIFGKPTPLFPRIEPAADQK